MLCMCVCMYAMNAVLCMYVCGLCVYGVYVCMRCMYGMHACYIVFACMYDMLRGAMYATLCYLCMVCTDVMLCVYVCVKSKLCR